MDGDAERTSRRFSWPCRGRNRRESLAQEVMDVALGLHHALARQLLAKHGGFESATEGDSFILAFHTPADALGFAQVGEQHRADSVPAGPHRLLIIAPRTGDGGDDEEEDERVHRAQAFQSGLLDQPWPEELLDCHLTRTIGTKVGAAFSLIDATLEPASCAQG